MVILWTLLTKNYDLPVNFTQKLHTYLITISCAVFEKTPINHSRTVPKKIFILEKLSNDKHYCAICSSHVLVNELIRSRVRAELIGTLLRLVAMQCGRNGYRVNSTT